MDPHKLAVAALDFDEADEVTEDEARVMTPAEFEARLLRSGRFSKEAARTLAARRPAVPEAF
jgi:hypothetical protein